MFDQNTNTNENIIQTGVFHMTNKKTNKIFTYEIAMFDQNTSTNENIIQTGVFHMTNKNQINIHL